VLGAENDGLEVKIPVHYPARVETQLVAEGRTSNAAEIPVKLPAGITTISGQVSHSLNTSFGSSARKSALRTCWRRYTSITGILS